MGSDFNTYSDGELARQCQDGSLAAFEELVYRYEGRIYGFVANACGNVEDARDVTQDTFVRAFQAIGQFDREHAFAPWLFTIARRKCIDRYRSAECGMRNAEGGVRNRDWWPVPEQADEDDPAELLARREERQDLWSLARRRLAESQFEVLWLRYVEGMDVADIARVLRKTRTHVKVLLFRARRLLARELKVGQGTGLEAGRVEAKPAPVWKVTRSPVDGKQNEARRVSGVEFSTVMASTGSAGARKGRV